MPECSNRTAALAKDDVCTEWEKRARRGGPGSAVVRRQDIDYGGDLSAAALIRLPLSSLRGSGESGAAVSCKPTRGDQ